MTDPTITRTDEFGHVRIDWPEFRQPFYPVADEVIAEMADTINRLADVREWAQMQSDAVRAQIRAITDPEAAK